MAKYPIWHVWLLNVSPLQSEPCYNRYKVEALDKYVAVTIAAKMAHDLGNEPIEAYVYELGYSPVNSEVPIKITSKKVFEPVRENFQDQESIRSIGRSPI